MMNRCVVGFVRYWVVNSSYLGPLDKFRPSSYCRTLYEFLLQWKMRFSFFPLPEAVQDPPQGMPCFDMHMCTYLFNGYHYSWSNFLQITNCLEEWQSGSQIKIPFSGDRYEAVYQEITSLISRTEDHSYHRQKLQKLLSSIATIGQYVFFLPSVLF